MTYANIAGEEISVTFKGSGKFLRNLKCKHDLRPSVISSLNLENLKRKCCLCSGICCGISEKKTFDKHLNVVLKQLFGVGCVGEALQVDFLSQPYLKHFQIPSIFTAEHLPRRRLWILHIRQSPKRIIFDESFSFYLETDKSEMKSRKKGSCSVDFK